MRPRASRLTVSVIAHNEAADLKACLASVKGFADELIVVDCASADDTARVARRAGARVLRRPNLANLNVNKGYGMARARSPWILYLDPDERVPPALKREILREIALKDACDGYDIPRRNHYFGRFLRHGGKFPDAQRRLCRRNRWAFAGRHIHEKLAIRGRVGRLRHALDHHPYPNMAVFLRKLAYYPAYEAGHLARRRVRPSVAVALNLCAWRPASRFVRRYVFRLGFLDGAPGFLACVHDALTHVLTYAYLREAFRRSR